MNCQTAKEQIQPALEGWKPAELEVHLAQCAECRLQWTLASTLSRALDRLPALEPPAEFPAMVMRRIAREAKARERWSVAGLAATTAALGGIAALVLPPAFAAAFPWLARGFSAATVWLAGAASTAWEGLVFAAAKILPIASAGGKLALSGTAVWWLAAFATAFLLAELAGMAALARQGMRAMREG